MFRLGPIAVDLCGEGPVCAEVRDELSVLEPAVGEQPTVVFRFVDAVASPEGAVHVGDWRFGDRSVSGRVASHSFRMRRSGDGVYEVDVATDRRRRRPADAVSRVWNWNYLGPVQRAAKNFMYGLFDTVTALALLDRGASYLHAASFVHREEATAIVAWGGVGKTTSVLKLLDGGVARYLSDDLGIVDAEGRAWRTPKRLQIYAYNVEGEGRLKRRLLEGRGAVDRLHWHWRQLRFGPKKVRRRVDAEELFDAQRVASSAPLRRVLFLERAEMPEHDVKKLENVEMARRTTAVLVDELEVLFGMALASESHGVDVGIPTSLELRAKVKKVVSEAFSGCELLEVRVPVGAGPAELMEVIRGVWG